MKGTQIDPEIKRMVLLRSEISTWARNCGLDDEDQLSASEAYEMLEQGIEDFLDKQESTLSQHHKAEMIEAVVAERKRIAALIDFNLEDVCVNGKWVSDEQAFLQSLTDQERNT